MRTTKTLTEKAVKAIKADGSHPVGGATGLYIVVSGQSRLWSYRYTNPTTGKRTWYTIGRSSEIGLAEARDEARRLAAMVRQGIAPVDARRAEKASFRGTLLNDVFEQWIEKRREAGYYRENESGEYITRKALGKHVLPAIGNRDIRTITPRDLADCLLVPWSSQKSLFGKLRADLTSLFRFAKAHGYITDDPSDMRGDCGALLHETGKKDQQTRNWGALLPEEVPEFWEELKALYQSHCVLAFRLSVLTCTRAANIRLMRWRDVDLKTGRWVISLGKMKTKRDGLVVTLSRQAIELLNDIGRGNPDDYVFPAGKSGRTPHKKFYFKRAVESVNCRRAAAGKQKWIDVVQTEKFGRTIEITQHGIARATFKTWTKSFGNWKRYSSDAVEMCLGHKTDAYGGAYDRAALEAEKRQVLQAWADYLDGLPTDDASCG